MVEGPYSVAENADALVILTEWDQFRALDFERLSRQMKQPVMVDLRNIYNPDDLRQNGFTYVSIGRK
jgi:UDPglucose 6-dehydrogenase